MNETVSVLQDALAAFLQDNALQIDTHFHTPEQWQARREGVGEKALLTLTAEGAFYQLMNAPNASQQHLIKEFNRILAEHGFWYEQGYAWSFHFYRLEHP